MRAPFVLLACVGCAMLVAGDAHADPLTTTAIGAPQFQIVDYHMFTDKIGTAQDQTATPDGVEIEPNRVRRGCSSASFQTNTRLVLGGVRLHLLGGGNEPIASFAPHSWGASRRTMISSGN